MDNLSTAHQSTASETHIGHTAQVHPEVIRPPHGAPHEPESCVGSAYARCLSSSTRSCGGLQHPCPPYAALQSQLRPPGEGLPPPPTLRAAPPSWRLRRCYRGKGFGEGRVVSSGLGVLSGRIERGRGGFWALADGQVAGGSKKRAGSLLARSAAGLAATADGLRPAPLVARGAPGPR